MINSLRMAAFTGLPVPCSITGGILAILWILPKDILVQYVVWLRSKIRYDSHPLYENMDVSGTINSYVRAAKAFFNFLLENEYTDIRFTKGLRLPKSDSDQDRPSQE